MTDVRHWRILVWRGMEFIETPVFTKIITNLIEDRLYMDLQEYLLGNPKKGRVILGSGGCGKLRFKSHTKGKRGGIRVIYYVMSDNKIYMLYAYTKSKTEDLTKDQIKQLENLIEEV